MKVSCDVTFSDGMFEVETSVEGLPFSMQRVSTEHLTSYISERTNPADSEYLFRDWTPKDVDVLERSLE